MYTGSTTSMYLLGCMPVTCLRAAFPMRSWIHPVLIVSALRLRIWRKIEASTSENRRGKIFTQSTHAQVFPEDMHVEPAQLSLDEQIMLIMLIAVIGLVRW